MTMGPFLEGEAGQLGSQTREGGNFCYGHIDITGYESLFDFAEVLCMIEN
jgi:hypothetical protein